MFPSSRIKIFKLFYTKVSVGREGNERFSDRAVAYSGKNRFRLSAGDRRARSAAVRYADVTARQPVAVGTRKSCHACSTTCCRVYFSSFFLPSRKRPRYEWLATRQSPPWPRAPYSVFGRRAGGRTSARPTNEHRTANEHETTAARRGTREHVTVCPPVPRRMRNAHRDRSLRAVLGPDHPSYQRNSPGRFSILYRLRYCYLFALSGVLLFCVRFFFLPTDPFGRLQNGKWMHIIFIPMLTIRIQFVRGSRHSTPLTIYRNLSRGDWFFFFWFF